MTDSQRPYDWRERLWAFAGRWLSYSGAYILTLLALHIADAYFGWSPFGEIRIKGTSLFMGAALGFVFALYPRLWVPDFMQRWRRGVYVDGRWRAKKIDKKDQPTMRDILRRIHQIINER